MSRENFVDIYIENIKIIIDTNKNRE